MNAITKKRSLGQFFTKNHFWLKAHILDFITSTNRETIVDPYAGGGDLLQVAKKLGFRETIGFDIDKSLPWEINDSLISIPKIKNSLIITNPPYLTNYSAKRKKIFNNVKKYFESCAYDDLYQLAIEKSMASSDFGVMIIPETFINSSFPKNRLHSITVIEDLMFHDTETPICVICFDNKYKSLDKVQVYKNDEYIDTLGHLEKLRKKPKKNTSITFNSIDGQIALRAVDMTTIDKMIQFMESEELNYDRKNIKISSRLITLIDMDIDRDLLLPVITNSNRILQQYRNETNDLLLSPFKGNNKEGRRRRRLDYKTARAILEESIDSISPKHKLF